MTEKRFTQKDEDDWEILDRNKHFAYAHSGYQAEKIIQELNELVETNRELYKDNKQLKSEHKVLHMQYQDLKRFVTNNFDEYQTQEKLNRKITKLVEENEQLKLQYSELEITLMNNQLAYNDLKKENEQLKQQIKIFEKFLEANDLDIDWVEFCGVDECAFENPDFSCQECIHLKGDVE